MVINRNTIKRRINGVGNLIKSLSYGAFIMLTMFATMVSAMCLGTSTSLKITTWLWKGAILSGLVMEAASVLEACTEEKDTTEMQKDDVAAEAILKDIDNKIEKAELPTLSRNKDTKDIRKWIDEVIKYTDNVLSGSPTFFSIQPNIEDIRSINLRAKDFRKKCLPETKQCMDSDVVTCSAAVTFGLVVFPHYCVSILPKFFDCGRS